MITFSEFMKMMDEQALRPTKYKPGAIIPTIGPKIGGAAMDLFKVVKPQKVQPYRPFKIKKKSSIVGEK